MDVNQAIRKLEIVYPGLKIRNFKEELDVQDPKGRCSMELHVNGRVIPCEGHLKDFQSLNKLFVEKIETLLSQ